MNQHSNQRLNNRIDADSNASATTLESPAIFSTADGAAVDNLPGGVELLDVVYNVRMRAAVGGAHEHGGRHLSGAERLVLPGELEFEVLDLLRRAQRHGVDPDFVKITVERIPINDVAEAQCLPLTRASAATLQESHEQALGHLVECGVSSKVARTAFDRLSDGFNAGRAPLRGAALIDASTGERLDPVTERGLRASRFDYAPDSRAAVVETLAAHGLQHFRTREAIALATKVIWSGVLAELCWSDEPGYSAGYVATARHGYVRFAPFKPPDAVGGRVFFFDPSGAPPDQIINRLERQALWVKAPLRVML